MMMREPGRISSGLARRLASRITSTGTLKPLDSVSAVSPGETSTMGAPSTVQPRCRSEAGVVIGCDAIAC